MNMYEYVNTGSWGVQLIMFLPWNQITNLEISLLLLSGGMNMNMYEYVIS